MSFVFHWLCLLVTIWGTIMEFYLLSSSRLHMFLYGFLFLDLPSRSWLQPSYYTNQFISHINWPTLFPPLLCCLVQVPQIDFVHMHFFLLIHFQLFLARHSTSNICSKNHKLYHYLQAACNSISETVFCITNKTQFHQTFPKEPM